MTTDTDLVARVVAGDREAFERVYAASFAAVYARAARRTPDRARAEALTEAILRRTFAALAAYTGDVPFAAWLLEIAKQVERELGEGAARLRLATRETGALAPNGGELRLPPRAL